MTALGVVGGIRFNPPPTPDEVVHIHKPLSYMSWHGEVSNYEHGSIYWTWGMVVCNALTALGGRGYLVGPPPIDWVVHARYHQPTQEPIFNARIFTGILHVGDYSWWYMAWQHLSWVGVFASPPTPQLGRAHARIYWPTWAWHDVERPISMIMAISILNFKHIFEIILSDNFLRLMFAYTTRAVYLTLSFKFWNLFIKFTWNYILPIHGQK